MAHHQLMPHEVFRPRLQQRMPICAAGSPQHMERRSVHNVPGSHWLVAGERSIRNTRVKDYTYVASSLKCYELLMLLITRTM